jgi:hypothetical protein
VLKSELQQQYQAELTTALLECRQGTLQITPLAASPWVAMSVLQKSLRRGEVSLALQAAATLLSVDPDRLWRRIVCAAYEDIGLGGADTIALVLGAMSGKLFRRSLGGDWKVASFLVERLALSSKCRAADDLLMVLQVHPSFSKVRHLLAGYDFPDLMTVICGEGDIVVKGIALSYALGTDRWQPVGLKWTHGDATLVFQQMLDRGFPHCVLELGQMGYNRVREPLSMLMSLVSRSYQSAVLRAEEDDDLLPTELVGDVPVWALDAYTHEGKEALRRFLRRDAPINRFINNNVAPRQHLKFIGGLVFRGEGGLMRRRIQWEAAQDLRRKMEFEANACGIDDASEALSLLVQDIELLNRERRNGI